MKNVVSKSLWTMNAVMAAAITLSTMTLVPGTVQAQNRTISESSQQQLDQRLADVSVRLNLTDSQRGKVKPILRASMQKQMDILKRYGISPSEKPKLGVDQILSLRNELASHRNDTNSKLVGILDKSQMQAFQNIQAERREQLMKRSRG